MNHFCSRKRLLFFFFFYSGSKDLAITTDGQRHTMVHVADSLLLDQQSPSDNLQIEYFCKFNYISRNTALRYPISINEQEIAVARVTIWETAAHPNFIFLCVCVCVCVSVSYYSQLSF